MLMMPVAVGLFYTQVLISTNLLQDTITILTGQPVMANEPERLKYCDHQLGRLLETSLKSINTIIGI